MKIANKDARGYVQRLETFKGSNIFSEHRGKLYVVFSYGYHFPMFIYDKEARQWYGNSSKYSRTTSKQQGQCNPLVSDIIWKTASEMKGMI